MPGGRIAFTDWIARPRLEDGERRRLREWTQATRIETIAGYRQMLGRAGFGAIHAEDVSEQWRAVVRGRLAEYVGMRREHMRDVGAGRYDAFLRVYGFFATLLETGKLGGGRFVATA